MKIISFILLFLGLVFIFFILNPSYKSSFQAKIYYNLGEFNLSKTMAKDALELDVYNKMANHILTQSEISLEYEHYINLGNEYIELIEKMSKEKIDITKESKIKIMCDTMLDGYDNLKSSKFIKTDLKDRAKDIQSKFLMLKSELF